MVSVTDVDPPGEIELLDGEKFAVIFAEPNPELDAVQLKLEEAFWAFLNVR